MTTKSKKTNASVASLPIPSSLPLIDQVEKHLRDYLEEFIQSNQAARTVAQGLKVLGVGFYSIVDHLVFRSAQVDKTAHEWKELGYSLSQDSTAHIEVRHHLKTYHYLGYPSVLIDAIDSKQKSQKEAVDWLKQFGDKKIYRVGIHVEDLEQAVFYLEKQGIHFNGKIQGVRGSTYRFVRTAPQILEGKPVSSLEIIERHHGYQGF